MTIYEAMRAKLGREPTHAELKAEVRRILMEARAAAAQRGAPLHQRKRVRSF